MSTLSSTHGASSAALLGETIGENLRRTVERFGEHEALVVREQGYRATYQELWDQVTLAARALLAHGCRRAIGSGSGRPTATSGW
jgi:fatty-acyl-CoA synthase